MKKRILSFGVPATQDVFTQLGSLDVVFSISDYDAFVFDPSALTQGTVSTDNYVRRQNEIRDLVVGKGGIAICLMRPNSPVGFPLAGRGAGCPG
jgi:hypothetical protein